MSFLGALVLGLVVGRTLPVGLLPEAPIPQITVQISYPNTSARELEDAVVQPLRNQLLQVGRLEDIESRTRSNSARITLTFAFGTDTDLAFIEVNEKIDQAAGLLPRELERPRVVKANVADIPVLYLSLTPAPGREDAATPLELSDFARAVVKRRIEQLPQVAFVDLSGYAEPEAVILPRTDLLRAAGLSARDLESIIADNNLELGSILVQDGQYQYNVRFQSALRSPEDIEGLYFRHEGRVLQIADVAEVRLQPRAPRGAYRYNGRPGIVLTVRKQADAQLFALQRDFEVLLADLRAQYPQLDFAVTHDQSELLRVSIDNLLGSLGYGAFFAFLILFTFFREWRAPLLIGVAVPLALIVAFLGFYLAGLTVNVTSLAGLILGVGLMIDNSIIVIENIRQQRRMGYPLPEACVRGGEEVIRPLLSSALTTCSVFLPLVFLSGIAGALFYDQAVSISIALGSSLIVAYILLPTLMRLVGRRGDGGQSAVGSRQSAVGGEQQRGYKWYLRSVDFALDRRWLTLAFFLAFVGSAFFLLREIPQERFPRLSRPALEVDIDWNEAIDLRENERRVLALLEHFDTLVTVSNAFIGEQQFLLSEEEPALNEVQLVLYQDSLPLPAFRERLLDRLRQSYPQAVVSARPLRNLFDEIFGAEQPPLVAQVQSARNRTTPEPAEAAPLLDFLEARGRPAELPPREALYAIRVQRAVALRYRVPVDYVFSALRTLFSQNDIGTLRSADRSMPIVVGSRLQSFYRQLNEATVENEEGRRLPLRYFIEVSRDEAYKELTAGRAGEVLRLPFAEYDAGLVAAIRDFLRRDGTLTAYFSGQYYDNRALLRELAVVMAVSLLLLYLILAAQFESLVQPLIVLLTVPVGLTGALLTLYLAGESLNLVAVIGMVVMSGIVVNDAILKVDMMNRRRRVDRINRMNRMEEDSMRGMDRKSEGRAFPPLHSDRGSLNLNDKAPAGNETLNPSGHEAMNLLREAIHIAGLRRLRPILMTSLTTMLALAPVLLTTGLGAELQRPLAWAVIGGLAAGTVASLYFVPVLYGLLARQEGKKASGT